LGNEGQSFVNSSGGFVVFSDLSFEGFMGLFSLEVGLIEGLSVGILVFHELIDSVLQLGSSGDQ
jgi:hypothetical protein